MTDVNTAGWEKYLTDPSLGLIQSLRPAQIRMAHCVEEILQNKGHAFIQAGTGTGKSYGYGVPAMWSGKRVVISTAKKALQQQLVRKDFPRLAEIVKPTIVKSLKGKGNYLCTLRYEQAVAGMSLSGFDTTLTARFDSWATSALAGDMADFGEEVPFDYLVRVQECGKASCPNAGECTYLKARYEAMGAKVLVVNHALLAFDLRMGGGKLLGPYDALIIDEAHQAPRAFEQAFSYTFSERHGDQIERAMQGQWTVKVPPSIRKAYQELFKVLSRMPFGRVDPTGPVQHAAEELLGALGSIPSAKRKQEDEGVLDFDPSDLPKKTTPAVEPNATEAGWAATTVSQHTEGLSVLLGGGDLRTEYVAYLEEDGKDRQKLVIAPIEVGPLVAPALMGINKCIYTSATLASGDGFGYHLREFGLASAQVRIQEVLPSPFDYKRRSMLWVSKDVPAKDNNNRDHYLDAQATEVHDLLDASGGGAFVICPSYADLNALYDRVMKRTKADTKYRPILQKNAAVDPLVAEFKRGWNNVLFGVRAISEGVDIPGLKLRLVIITGLCFPHPGNALNQARKDLTARRLLDAGTEDRRAGMLAFERHDVQAAGIELAQGAGRLIRTESDYGVLAILDPRMLTGAKGYTAGLRRLIPHPTCASKTDAIQMLVALRGAATKASQGSTNAADAA